MARSTEMYQDYDFDIPAVFVLYSTGSEVYADVAQGHYVYGYLNSNGEGMHCSFFSDNHIRLHVRSYISYLTHYDLQYSNSGICRRSCFVYPSILQVKKGS